MSDASLKMSDSTFGGLPRPTVTTGEGWSTPIIRSSTAPAPVIRQFGDRAARWLLSALALIAISACIAGEEQFPSPGDETESTSKASGRELELRVDRLVDGDSFTATDATGGRYKVRLAAIDAPERSQPGGQAAGDFLARQLNGRWLTLQIRKTDRYGRLVGRVLVAKRDIGLALVTEGLAWHFKRYEKDQPADERSRFRAAQNSAQQAGKGIWHTNNPIPPWDWRKANRQQ